MICQRGPAGSGQTWPSQTRKLAAERPFIIVKNALRWSRNWYRVETIMPTKSSELSFVLTGADATLEFGRRFAASALRPGLQVHLLGDLGAGKTTLVRGILRGAGYTGRVKSPTYPLVEIYNLSRLNFYHFDFYRVTDPSEIDARGLREYFTGDAACFVEWPERASGRLPAPDLEVRFAFDGDAARTIAIRAVTGVGETCLNEWGRTASGDA